MKLTDLELLHFLEPVQPSWVDHPGVAREESFGAAVAFNKGKAGWFSKLACDVVIVGVPEARNGMGNKSCDLAPSLIRHWLYGMRSCAEGITVADAGDVRGISLNDRYQALYEVVKWFAAKNIVVLVAGGSQELTVPVVQALKQQEGELAVAIVDPGIDMDETHSDFSSQTYINRLLFEEDCRVDDLTLMGCQYYYYSSGKEALLKKQYCSLLRLNEMRPPNISKTEVVLRDSAFLSFDFRAIEKQGGLLPGAISPNGLSSLDACQIMWYAGASDILKVAGLFEMAVTKHPSSENGPLSAQMIWHFIEGMAARSGDYPLKPLEEYKYLVVPVDRMGETLHFYHSQMTDRWWMEVPNGVKSKVVSCHISDYNQALNNELPEKWWRFFLKAKAVDDLKQPVDGPNSTDAFEKNNR